MKSITSYNKTRNSLLKNIDQSWCPIVDLALSNMDDNYVLSLLRDDQWLPGPNMIFNAFSEPLPTIRYILLGESPYPRKESANGYAFWDARVGTLWSENGLSKEVNKATSLRNLVKMLLVADGKLSSFDLSQEAISKIPKSNYVQTLDQLFNNFLNHGFLLLNASLVLSNNSVTKDAKQWLPFLEIIINELYKFNKKAKFVLLGKISQRVQKLQIKPIGKIVAEHPYNYSFITNNTILKFFKPLNLLQK